MAMQVPEEEAPQGAPLWVVTFGDMMSLLLCFFVLLLSFSTLEVAKFKVVAGFMRQAFGLQTKESYTGVPMGSTIMSTDARDSTEVSDEISLIQEVKRAMKDAGMSSKGSVHKTERGVVMQLEGEVVFPSGKAELRPEVAALLDRIAEIAASRDGTIEVEGHTDDVPISNPRFPSNWELSSARAGAAVRYLIDHGVPANRIRAIGYADTRPVAPNTNSQERAKNRRVEFLFVAAQEDATAGAGNGAGEEFVPSLMGRPGEIAGQE